MKRQVLIADKRKELSTKYKKIIENLGHSVIITSKLNVTLKTIQMVEPDLILISDSIVDNLSDFCKQLRILTYKTRPVIIALSKSAELEDSMKVLENGADDFFSEPISSLEFKMRIFTHLRREQENNVNSISGFADKNYTLKMIRRTIVQKNKKAFMLISIENFNEYKSIYTEIASDKLIQTFTSIIKSSINENDFLGHLSDNEFVVITNPLSVEKISIFLNFAFDSVAEKFYSQQDLKRGYVIMQGDEKAGRRSEFVHCVIGVVTNEFKNYMSCEDILNSMYSIHNMAIKPSGSSYLIERPQLCAENSVSVQEYNNNILVLEKDDALSFLLVTTIELQGYNVFIKDEEQPAVIILDIGSIDNLDGLKICKNLKQKYSKSKIIMTSILHDKEKILSSGADLYLPKPYNIVTLMKWINIFIKEFNQ